MEILSLSRYENLKVNILFKFKEGPWGGGNNFLRILRNYLIKKKIYTRHVTEADIVIFNSDKASIFYLTKFLFPLKLKYDKCIINRIDGPISLRSTSLNFMDKLIGRINTDLSDGAIFQSNWSFKEMNKINNIDSKRCTIIHNAANKELFYPNSAIKNDGKIKLIAASWSDNYEYKGFKIYEYLDKNLDFSKYEMYFVGNSKIRFNNIKYINSVSQEKLGEYFRKSDIFISASKFESCSNIVIEALQCGLPSVLIDSGSLPELLQGAGLTFYNERDILGKIGKVSDNLDSFKSKINVPLQDEICEKYLTFIYKISSIKKSNFNQYRLKRLRLELIVRFYIDYIFRRIKKNE